MSPREQIRRVGVPIAVVAVAASLFTKAPGCVDVPGKCPESDERFAPSEGPDACVCDGGVADSEMQCPGGAGWNFEDHVLVWCDGDVCAEGYGCSERHEEFGCEDVLWYCVNKADLESWRDRSCPQCNLHCNVTERTFAKAETCSILCDPEK